MEDLIGKAIDRYEIVELLGRGGMATVYKARDTRLDRDVALKVIRREAFPAEQFDMILKRFEREAKSLGRLSHPNIVSVMDYGEYDGAPYLVMAYLSGGTLKDKLGKPIPWREAVQWILPIARALEYVHERGIINRDVKPSNILMTEKDQPMLTDFGLVKLFEAQESHLTASGAGVGTPDYMSPEQWTGEASALSDMYSLGVVLYEMITGYRPYTADTPAGVLIKQINEPLPLPNQYVSDLPKGIESVLLKTLARDPQDRYPNMRALADELQALSEGRDPAAAAIKTEQLRERMTGKFKKQELEEARKQITQAQTAQTVKFEAPQAPPPLPPAAQAGSNFSTKIAIFGGIALLLLCGGAWLAYASFGATAEPTPTLPAVAPPTDAEPMPIASSTPPPPAESPVPTDTPPPAATPMPVEITDEKNIFMRLIPGGEFTMGSADGPIESRPESRLNLDTFYMDKYEVSNEQYAACVDAGICRRPKQGGSITHSGYYAVPEFANHPVLFVDWKMAMTYCEWRGARLPTEAEWEKAARGADGRKFSWGNSSFSCDLANRTGCMGDTAPVNAYEQGQSVYGVYGMIGNVWEWTSSFYKVYPYAATDGREDPTVAGNRVLRGGSWHHFGADGEVYTYSRFKADWTYNGVYVGFRCAADP